MREGVRAAVREADQGVGWRRRCCWRRWRRCCWRRWRRCCWRRWRWCCWRRRGRGEGVGRAACLRSELPLLRRLLHRLDVGVLVLGSDRRRLRVVARRARRLPTRLTGLVEPAKAPGTGAWHSPRRGTRGVGVGSRGGAPASRARVDRLRTLATLVRVGGRVHEHAVLWMLAIRERRLARWRSRLVAAAHMRSMRGSAEREREARVGSRCVCSPLRSGVRAEHFGPCRHGYPHGFGELRAKEEAAADVKAEQKSHLPRCGVCVLFGCGWFILK